MKYTYYFPAALWAGLIFIAISLPAGNIPDSGLLRLPHIDKFIHLFLFLVQSMLFAYGYMRHSKAKANVCRRMVIITMVIVASYGVFTELFQHFFLSDRHASIFDLIANLFGTVFGIILSCWLFGIRHHKRP
jgi:VanZ family protein